MGINHKEMFLASSSTKYLLTSTFPTSPCQSYDSATRVDNRSWRIMNVKQWPVSTHKKRRGCQQRDECPHNKIILTRHRCAAFGSMTNTTILFILCGNRSLVIMGVYIYTLLFSNTYTVVSSHRMYTRCPGIFCFLLENANLVLNASKI